jgi:DNA-binding GntR family transcriptional regulator
MASEDSTVVASAERARLAELPPASSSVAASTYEQVRQRILLGVLPPESPLALADLADELGVSTMPVRAALARLTNEGLVRKLRSRVSIVAPLEIEDFEEIQAVRAGIEALAARLGVERIDQAGLDQMRGHLERLAELSAAERLDEYRSEEWDLHAVCYRAAGRPRLLGLVQDYRLRAERYSRLAIVSSPGFSRPLHIQQRFFNCAAARDGAGAVVVIREALDWSIVQVAQVLGSR